MIKNIRIPSSLIILPISFLPFFLVTGPFISDLVVSLSSLIFLFYAFKKKTFFYLKKLPIKIFFIFCLYCILCSLFSDNILFSLKASFFYFRIGIFVCLICFLIDEEPIILNYFYYCLLICFVVLCFDGYLQYFTYESIGGYRRTSLRVSSFFGEELILGSYLSRLFPLLFAFFVIRKKKFKYEIYFIGLLFILIDVLIFISGERSAFFFLNLSTIFIIFFIKKYKKFRIITFLIALCFVSFLTLKSNVYKKRMLLDPLKDISTFAKNDKDSIVIFSKLHDGLIKTGIKMFLDKPLIGHGPKLFRYKCSDPNYSVGKKSCSTHPHNFYIQLLAETGLIGFSFLLCVFLYVVYISLAQLKSALFLKTQTLTDYQVCLLSAILISVWPFAPNGNFFNNWLLIIYGLPFGFYLHSIYSPHSNLYK